MKRVGGVDRTVEMAAAAKVRDEGLLPESGYRHEVPEVRHRTIPWMALSQRLTLLLDLIARINSLMDLPSLLAATNEGAMGSAGWRKKIFRT
jgi:hypothetical protein